MTINKPPSAAVIGAGPAGLMAAEVLAQAGVKVDVYERMPSVGRKLLMAGKGGLNITHAEPYPAFMSRYGVRRAQLDPLISAFGPDALREWVQALGIETFVGTSGRVFPHEMKAAPLLRAWLHRLRAAGVKIHVRHRWRGWDAEGALLFDTPNGERNVSPDVTILALGGASWPKLGSDGAWVALLGERGVKIETLRPANSGFEIEWSEHLRTRFAGHPLKAIAGVFTDDSGVRHRRRGELIVTETGIEGGLVYALSALLRERIDAHGSAILELDLAPDWDVPRLTDALSKPRGSRSLSSHVQSKTGIRGVKMSLLREVLSAEEIADPQRLAAAVKALPLKLARARPLEEAISTAGGVSFEALDESLMIRALPGIFCAGEMLDWEAPTGGYLLTACFATGRAAGAGAVNWLGQKNP